MTARERDLFSKIVPNIKLATRFDADGNEIQVERREDEEQNAKQKQIIEILVAAGYYRALIIGLSDFDKIVGGMTWCIGACDYDVDVDLLFHENLTIGQKIALTEKIVVVLPKMKCPHLIEPHQIQGLDYIHIFPVMEWLVKRSEQNRAEKAERLKAFAIGQFHNYFALKSDQDSKEKYINGTSCVQHIQHIYGPRRQYKRKNAAPDDEETRARITLLEYGSRGLFVPNPGAATPTKEKTADLMIEDEGGPPVNEIDVAQLLKNLYVANEEHGSTASRTDLTDAEKVTLQKHYTDLKTELSIDTKQLSERSQVKALQNAKAALERKLKKIQDDNRGLDKRLADEKHVVEKMQTEGKELRAEIRALNDFEVKDDKEVLKNIQNLVIKNEELKQQEIKFKEQCRVELASLQQQIRQCEETTPDEDIHESQQQLEKEREHLQTVRLQLAKKNRAIVSMQRQLDNVPDRTELAQYQRRFLELYNQVSAKHRETKQFYTLYNTLDDTKLYLAKELSLLNSIYETYADGMSNAQSREQFLQQLETIVDGVKQTKTKVKNKCDDEKAKRDGLNAQLLCLVEQQRKYAAAVKQFTSDCKRNEDLMLRLKSLQ